MKKTANERTGNCGAGLGDLLIPWETLADAGIDPDDVVETICGEGEVIIRQRSILERLPEELREHCMATGLSEAALETAFRIEAEEAGGVQSLLETSGGELF